MQVVAEAEINDVLELSPTRLWETTKALAGITRSKYREYFKGCKTAYAYQLGEIQIFDPVRTLEDYGITVPPQSFVYINE